MKNSSEEKEETKKFHIKELFTNKQYRSIIILVFYVILFTILIVGLRTPNKPLNNNGTGTVKSNLEGYELIDKKNFSYKYTVNADDEVFVFAGKKYNNEDLVTLTKDEKVKEYYFIEDKTYVKENNKYIESLNKPVVVFDFFNTTLLDTLISRGTLINEENHEYKIDNQTLYDVLSNDSIKVDKESNYITLSYRNSYIIGITLDLSNYSKMLGGKYKKVIITLEYFDFNLTEKFSINI